MLVPYAIRIAAAESRTSVLDPTNPWREDDDPQEPSGVRVFIWFAVLVLLGLGVWWLSELFPGQVNSDLEQGRLIWLMILLAMISGGVVFARRVNVKETVRNIALWVAIAAVLLVVVSYRDELEDVAMRVRSELIPGYALEAGEHEMVLTESDGGNFYIMGQANGVRVRFLIDTGASDTVLSPTDAASLGIDVGALDFSKVYSTANGLGRGAPYMLDELSVGPVAIAPMPVSVNQAEMGSSLLGMTFLRRFRSFEIQGRRLILRY
jgi:aspartyl protease family protein